MSELVLDGVAYWGHDTNFPAAVEDLRENHLPTAAFIAANAVEVLEGSTWTTRTDRRAHVPPSV